MDGDTGVQTLADIWKWTKDMFGEEFCGDRDQGEGGFSVSHLLYASSPLWL